MINNLFIIKKKSMKVIYILLSLVILSTVKAQLTQTCPLTQHSTCPIFLIYLQLLYVILQIQYVME